MKVCKWERENVEKKKKESKNECLMKFHHT